MIVRAGDLPPEGLPIDLSPDLGHLSDEAGLEIDVVGAALRAALFPSRGGIRCSGRLEATAVVRCSRCLEPYSLPVARDFEVAYLPDAPRDVDEGSEQQISRDDLDVAYLGEEDSLDMDSLAAEQIYLALPMKPLCSSQCRGLCQTCGGNLNGGGCHCRPSA